MADKEHIHKLGAQLPTPNNRLNLLCPSGVGDVTWLLTKFKSLTTSRDIIFWLPDDEQHRADQYLRICGCKYGFLPNLSTHDVWNTPGNPDIPVTGATLVVHPNSHLEAGKRIEQWYPSLPFKNPNPNLLGTNHWLEMGKKPFVCFIPCSWNYMGGTLMVRHWADICKQVHKDIGPVRFIGAGYDGEFINAILEHYQSPFPVIYDQPIDLVLNIMLKSKGAFGPASGPLICGTYAGAKTYFAYPLHLKKMPSTWENHTAKTSWCFMDELSEKVKNGTVLQFLS